MDRGERQEERGEENATSPVDASDVQVKLQGAASIPAENDDKREKKGGEEEQSSPCPLPRINPCLTVRGNTLYVYGGILEVGNILLYSLPAKMLCLSGALNSVLKHGVDGVSAERFRMLDTGECLRVDFPPE